MTDNERVKSLAMHHHRMSNANSSLPQLKMSKGYSEPAMVMNKQGTNRMSICLDSSSLNVAQDIKEEESVNSDDPDLSRIEDSEYDSKICLNNNPENYISSDQNYT